MCSSNCHLPSHISAGNSCGSETSGHAGRQPNTSIPPSHSGVRWQLINANTDFQICPTSQGISRESTAACARQGFGKCNRMSAQHCALHGRWLLAAAPDHSKEHSYGSGSQCPCSCCHPVADLTVPIKRKCNFSFSCFFLYESTAR